MRVYLDQGDLANLERTQTRFPDAFEKFLRDWHELGCELLLSLHHAQETAQLGDEASRGRRIALLARFPRVYFEAGGSEKVIRLEIMSQLFARIGNYAPTFREVIAGALFSDEGLEGFKTTVAGSGDLLRLFAEPHQLSTDARNASRGNTRPRSFRRQTRDLIDLTAAKAQFEQTLAAENHPPAVKDLMRNLFNTMASNVADAANMRTALERMYGLEGYECLPKVSDDDLAHVATFFATAREEVQQIAALVKVDPAIIAAGVPKLDPYASPGFALEVAVTRGQDASPKVGEASDEPDRAHIAFLPYVDLMFADKRTVGFVEQGVRSSTGSAIREHLARLRRSTPGPEALIETVRRALNGRGDR